MPAPFQGTLKPVPLSEPSAFYFRRSEDNVPDLALSVNGNVAIVSHKRKHGEHWTEAVNGRNDLLGLGRFICARPEICGVFAESCAKGFSIAQCGGIARHEPLDALAKVQTFWWLVQMCSPLWSSKCWGGSPGDGP